MRQTGGRWPSSSAWPACRCSRATIQFQAAGAYPNNAANGVAWQTDIFNGVHGDANLAGVSVLTRCFFFILDRPWGLPEWAHRALHYAPVAALSAVVIPEIVMTQGHLVTTLHDARIYAAVAGAAYYFWRHGVLGTMLVGMAVYLPLHLGLGW